MLSVSFAGPLICDDIWAWRIGHTYDYPPCSPKYAMNALERISKYIYLDLRMDWLVCMCPNHFSAPQLRSSRDFDNMWHFVRCRISDLNLGYPNWNSANCHVQDVAGHFGIYSFAATSIFVALRSTTRSLFLPILSSRWLLLCHVIKLSLQAGRGKRTVRQ